MIDKTTTTRQKYGLERQLKPVHSLKRLPDTLHFTKKVFLVTILPTSVYDCIVLVST